MGALSVANGELDLFGRYPNTMKNPLILKNVKVSLFDGELTISQLTFPQSKMATLSFTNIDLAQVLALAQYNQVTLTGRANATLPFWFGHKECLICNGTLEQVGKCIHQIKPMNDKRAEKRRLDREYFGGFIKRNGVEELPCDCDARSERTNDVACEH